MRADWIKVSAPSNENKALGEKAALIKLQWHWKYQRFILRRDEDPKDFLSFFKKLFRGFCSNRR